MKKKTVTLIEIKPCTSYDFNSKVYSSLYNQGDNFTHSHIIKLVINQINAMKLAECLVRNALKMKSKTRKIYVTIYCIHYSIFFSLYD